MLSKGQFPNDDISYRFTARKGKQLPFEGSESWGQDGS